MNQPMHRYITSVALIVAAGMILLISVTTPQQRIERCVAKHKADSWEYQMQAAKEFRAYADDEIVYALFDKAREARDKIPDCYK